MTKFTIEQKKVMFNAVRYYQMNRVPLNGKEYGICDEILESLFTETKLKQ